MGLRNLLPFGFINVAINYFLAFLPLFQFGLGQTYFAALLWSQNPLASDSGNIIFRRCNTSLQYISHTESRKINRKSRLRTKKWRRKAFQEFKLLMKERKMHQNLHCTLTSLWNDACPYLWIRVAAYKPLDICWYLGCTKIQFTLFVKPLLKFLFWQNNPGIGTTLDCFLIIWLSLVPLRFLISRWSISSSPPYTVLLNFHNLYFLNLH